MSNFITTVIYVFKFYILWIVCKFMFSACYKLCKLTAEQSEVYRILYQQNRAILNKESYTLLSNQIIECESKNNKAKNKAILSKRLNQINFDEF